MTDLIQRLDQLRETYPPCNAAVLSLIGDLRRGRVTLAPPPAADDVVLPALTPPQARIFNFMVNRINRHGIPPTVREIGTEFGINSPNGVMCHINALQRKGYITRDARLSRSITLLRRAAVQVPG